MHARSYRPNIFRHSRLVQPSNCFEQNCKTAVLAKQTKTKLSDENHCQQYTHFYSLQLKMAMLLQYFAANILVESSYIGRSNTFFLHASVYMH